MNQKHGLAMGRIRGYPLSHGRVNGQSMGSDSSSSSMRMEFVVSEGAELVLEPLSGSESFIASVAPSGSMIYQPNIAINGPMNLKIR